MTKENETIKKNTKAGSAAAEVRQQVPEAEIQEPENSKVGAVLYHERVKKELSLAEISQVLCIRKAYLDAIEKGNYSELPSMPYSAGFVNAYAKYLGLNNTRITQLFREEINVDTKSARSFVNEDITAEASVPNKLYVMIGIGAAVLIALAWTLFSPASAPEIVDEDKVITVEETTEKTTLTEDVEYFEPQTEEQDVQDKKKIKAEENTSVEKEETEKESSSRPATPAEEKKVEVDDTPRLTPKMEIKITKEDTWIEVKDANKVYINKVLRVGENYRFPDVKGLTLSVGKVQGVDVYVDGKIVKIIQPNKKMNINVDEALKANH